jgi:hypothetical protein
MSSLLHVDISTAANKVVQYVRRGREDESGLDHIDLAETLLGVIVCFHVPSQMSHCSMILTEYLFQGCEGHYASLDSRHRVICCDED